MKKYMVLLLILLAGCVESTNNNVSNNTIIYKSAPEAVNQETEEAITKALQDRSISSISMPMLICGPYLTENLEGEKIQGVSGKVKIPIRENGKLVTMLEMENKLLQGESQVASFWEVMLRKYTFSDVKVRKLNENEKKMYWAMIPYDIEEPIFIAQTNEISLLIDFSKDEYGHKVFYVDDLKD